MPYRVNCPICKTAYSVPEDFLGKKLLCAKCRQPFSVGTPKAPAPAAPKPPLPSASKAAAAGRTTTDLEPSSVAPSPPRRDTVTTRTALAGSAALSKKLVHAIVVAVTAVLLFLARSRRSRLAITAVLLFFAGVVVGVVGAFYFGKHPSDTPVVQTAAPRTEQQGTKAPPVETAEQPAPTKITTKEALADLDRVPRDAMAFCSLRVADTLKRPLAAGLRKQLQQEPTLNQFKALSGLGVEDIDRVVAVFLTLKPEIEGVALMTTVKPYDRQRLLFLIAPEKQEMKAGTTTYFVGQQNPLGVHFLNERTFIVGLGKDVKKFLERPAGKETPGPLSDALATAADTHTLVVGARPRLLMPIEKKDVPPPYQGYLPMLDAKSATLTLDADQDLRMSLRLAFADEV